jgi:hypothetical protein
VFNVYTLFKGLKMSNCHTHLSPLVITVQHRPISPVVLHQFETVLPPATPNNIKVLRTATGYTTQQIARAILMPRCEWTPYEALGQKNTPLPQVYWHALVKAALGPIDALQKAAQENNETLYRGAKRLAKTDTNAAHVLELLAASYAAGESDIYYVNIRLHLLLAGQPAPYRQLQVQEGDAYRSRPKNAVTSRTTKIEENQVRRELASAALELTKVQLQEAQARNEIAQRELAAKRLEMAYAKRYTRNKKD